MKYQDIVVVKRWIPILKEYERTKAKVTPRPFKFVKDLCEAHHITKKELGRYYRKWIEGGRKPESLLPQSECGMGSGMHIDLTLLQQKGDALLSFHFGFINGFKS